VQRCKTNKGEFKLFRKQTGGGSNNNDVSDGEDYIADHRGGAGAVQNSMNSPLTLKNILNKFTMFSSPSPILRWDGTKKFNETKDFLYNNIGKIVINFDKNETGDELVNLFIGDKFNGDVKILRQKIINRLFPDQSYIRIRYYICKDNSNVVFYDVENLRLLSEYLNKNGIIKTVDDLLELTCTWIDDYSSEDYALIKILFGSTNICGWQSVNKDNLYNILSMENNMQKAYIEFIYASIEKIYITDDARKKSIHIILKNIFKILEDEYKKFMQKYNTLQGLSDKIKSFTSSNSTS